jgi:hypothetical protein
MSHPEFDKIIVDFTNDLLITFPEYKPIIDKFINNKPAIFKHCIKRFSAVYLHILYENSEIFSENSEINTEFLPGIVFKQLWNSNITENTKNTIWKYLQFILLYITPFIKDKGINEETANLFSAIDEEELKQKLEETINNIQNLFGNEQSENIPSPDSIKDHLQGLLKGKLGKIAMELAEELAKELGIDPDNTNPKDLFKILMQNPGKLKSIIANINKKFREKIDSGEIKESEIMEETADFLKNMKNMPGFGDLFKNMGMNMPSKNMNVPAMQAKLNQNIKKTKMKERMRDKLAAKKEAKLNPNNTTSQDNTPISDEDLIKMFQKK